MLFRNQRCIGCRWSFFLIRNPPAAKIRVKNRIPLPAFRMEHESDDMDGSVSNPEEEELNESEYGGSGDDDEERRTPLDGELSNDDEPSDVLARFQSHNNSGSNNGGNNGSVRSRQDDGSPVPLANNTGSSNHSSSTPPATSNGTPHGGLSSEPRIPAPNAVVSSSPGPMRVLDSGPLSALAARAAAASAAAALPLSAAAAIPGIPLSQAPALFGLATGAPHMMHLPPTLTPHTAAVSGASQESKYAFEEHYGKHFSINNLAAAWMTEMTKPNGGKNTEFSRDFKVSPTPKSSRSSRGGDSNGRVSSMDDISKLYELSNEPKRKEFLDDLFSFMQKRGTPVNRIPIMAKQVLDLFELYRLVVSRGGLVEVINKKIWREITKGLNLPSSITSAAFTLRTQYMKYLYPYECEKEKLSQPDELQAAIDGNRREGRRSSYSHYAEMMSTAATAASLSASRGSNHHTSPISLVCRQANGHAPSSAHHPAGGPSSGDEENSLSLYVPQQEALNLEVPRGGSADHKVIDPRRLLSESLGPPPAKRFIPSDEDHLLAQSMHTTHIKMNSRGDGRGQADNSMTVTMEVNGIIYHGVLYPQTHRNRLS